MDPVLRATLASFRFDPWLLGATLVTALVYLRGWRVLNAQMPRRFTRARLAAFLGGLVAFLVAVLSPLDAFSELLLSAHMVQHLLLTMVVAPLLLLGAPQVPLLRGLPARFVHDGLGPFLAAPELRATGRALAHPVVCLLAFTAATWLWHLPALYELALRSPGWHAVEHGCFLATALLFWWPVVAPWPSVPRWPRWTVVPYLLVADVQNTVLSALFVFSERVLYPTYAAAPRLGAGSALDDQALAGAIMWVLSSVGYLAPAAACAIRLLSPALAPPGGAAEAERAAALLAVPAPARRREARRFDLLETPLAGALLRRPGFRRAMQALLFGLAALVVLDGLLGPAMSPMNLAGVLPWTYWRPLALVTLLAAGNFFCMACPFLVPRELGRRFLPATRRWPRALRGKWLALALLVAYLGAYEAAGLWDSPFWTAWIVIGYAGAAFVVDGLFRGASFCKHVCPIGQFNFLASTLSPLEVRVKDQGACAACTTRDCLRGNATQRGCELELYLPRKAGNLDCTFCLDCVHACPHDNVGLLAVVPGADLTHDRRRSSLGRLAARPDVAALALVLVAAALAAAAAMVAPVVAWNGALARALGLPERTTMLVLLVAALVPLPLALAATCATLGRALSGTGTSRRELFCRFSLALLPLGASTWLAHLLFHLVTGGAALVPVVQRAAGDAGLSLLGAPRWMMAAGMGDVAWLTPLLVLILDAGLLASLWIAWRIACGYTGRPARGAALVAPWGVVACALYGAAVWILLQPMQMRGTMVHG